MKRGPKPLSDGEKKARCRSRHRSVLIAHLQGLSVREIAEATGRPTSLVRYVLKTVGVEIHRERAKRSQNRMAASRLKRRLTQQDVANALGVSQTYVSMIERGKRIPNDKVLSGIRRIYGRTLDLRSREELGRFLSGAKDANSTNLPGQKNWNRVHPASIKRHERRRLGG